jgi:hypothetical protein
LIHWWVTQSPSIFSATRSLPWSSWAEHVLDRFADLGRRLAGLDGGAVFPGLFDDLLIILHDDSL